MWPSVPQLLRLRNILYETDGEAKPVSFEKNKIIFSKGERSDALFYIKSGVVKLSVTSEPGKEAVLAILDGGTLFGEGCITHAPTSRRYNATALSETHALQIGRDTAIRCLRKESEHCYCLIVYLLECIELGHEELITNLLHSAEMRLARALVSISDFRKRNTVGLLPGLNHQQTLAEMIGITRQRVNVIMRHFRQRGLIGNAEGTVVNQSLRDYVAD